MINSIIISYNDTNTIYTYSIDHIYGIYMHKSTHTHASRKARKARSPRSTHAMCRTCLNTTTTHSTLYIILILTHMVFAEKTEETTKEMSTNNHNKLIVVGIGGATRSGKSTLASSLSQSWPSISPPLSMDAYFLPRERKPFNQALCCVDNESPESLDSGKFLADFDSECKKLQREVCENYSLVFVYL